jgi:predicted unusual protein kinase regulating ubiquinone biosynthesis (AarF/ABC1/UbiB family)
MPNPPFDKNDVYKKGRAVPRRRVSRMAGLGGMAAGIAGNVVAGGLRQLASGKRPEMSDLFMTPANALKLTRQLSNMRGAAMKMGQMISMDSDFLPKEFSDILARLRAEAQHMPYAQLEAVLNREWGEGWKKRFKSFQWHPIAAASIGQVHRGALPNGDVLAIKVQYPGVKESIDSDINNVAGLLKVSGLIPAHMDLKPVIEEGRKQLHAEADYIREAKYMMRFGQALADNPNFVVPTYYPDFSTDKILAMSFIESEPIESLIEAPQESRDRAAELLLDLTLRELFELKMMQTDPNFANYRYNEKTKAIVLLDFGASTDIESGLSEKYAEIMRIALEGERDEVFDLLVRLSFIPPEIPPQYKSKFLEMIETILEILQKDAPFDFGENGVVAQLQDDAMAIAANRDLWHVPPADMIFIQRKLGGLYLLATRLKAKVNVNRLMRRYLELTPPP